MFDEFRENFQLTWKVLGNEYFDLGCGGWNQILEFNFEVRSLQFVLEENKNVTLIG